MATFNILHLTDLHCGLKSQESLFPSVRAAFFDDLNRLHNNCGGFDLVLFTGDLTQHGHADEFTRFEELLKDLWARLRTYGSSDPILLAVPGNHDLIRPDANLPEVILLRELAGTFSWDKVWDELMSNPVSPYRRVLKEAFKNYQSWWDECPYRGKGRTDFSFHEGILPGDFSAVLQKGGARLGIVGLNTTFLQLTAGDYKGKLAVDPRQFIRACEGKGDAWFEDNVDACVLMTHQPPDWLAPSNQRDVFEMLVDREGRFAAHFCGHMHEPMAEARSQGWSRSRRLSLGGSLFGLEADARGETQRIHAYAACRIEVPEEAKEGGIRIWPRKAIRRAGNALQFDRDQSFTPDPDLRDEGTQAQTFPRLREPLNRNENDSVKRQAAGSAPPSPSPKRPDVGDAPVLDPQAQFRRHFIGRENHLGDFEDALLGLMARAGERATTRLRRVAEVQLFWLHGFGGMGKSWFLRKACIEAELLAPQPAVALIDWHLPDWHQPAYAPPDSPRDVFNAIAYRLAQLYGVEKLDMYWEVERTVAACWEQHRQLHDELDETFALLQSYGPDWQQIIFSQVIHGTLLTGSQAATSKRLGRLERLLRQRNEWSDDPAKLAQSLKEHRVCQLRFDSADGGLFESWAEEVSGGEKDAVKRPCGLLAGTLRDCLRTLCYSTPLVLILDTCELLPSALDSWLRRLLSPLLDGRTPLLVLVGSRQRPDPYLLPGERGGWRGCVDAPRLRIVPFDEDVRFTVAELDEALQRSSEERPDRPLPSDPELASMLHRVTLGVPLAFGTLLGLHWGEPPDNVLFELTSLDWDSADELDQNRAARKVIEVVAGRFFLHLENRPELTDELRDITALAILRSANTYILKKFWGVARPTDRLRTLAQRHALLAGGDLHPTVREYMRRYWHHEPPDRVKQVARELLRTLEQIRSENEAMDDAVRADWELERLNLLAWVCGEEAYPDFIRALVAFMAAGQEVGELLKIASEIRPARARGKEARKILNHPGWQDWRITGKRGDMLEAVSCLEEQKTGDWSDREHASLDLVAALTLAESGYHVEAVARFEQALEVFGASVPERETVARAYFKAVNKMGQSDAAKPVAERACHWATRLDLNLKEKWEEDYYWTLHNAHQYKEAEIYCRSVMDAEPDNESPHLFLAHLLGSHLGRPEEAKQVFLMALATNDEYPTMHEFYGDLLAGPLDQPEKALEEYRRALEIYEKKGYDKSLRARTLVEIGRTLAYRLNRRADAMQVWRKVLLLSPDDADILNTLAWNIYIFGGNLEEAESLIRRSVAQSPDDQNRLHTLAAILIRRGTWDEASPIYKAWLAQKGADTFRKKWKDYLPQFRDAVRLGHAAEMAGLMEGSDEDAFWPLMRAVLNALAEGRKEFPELPSHLWDAALKLCDQLLSADLNPPFPEV